MTTKINSTLLTEYKTDKKYNQRQCFKFDPNKLLKINKGKMAPAQISKKLNRLKIQKHFEELNGVDFELIDDQPPKNQRVRQYRESQLAAVKKEFLRQYS